MENFHVMSIERYSINPNCIYELNNKDKMK